MDLVAVEDEPQVDPETGSLLSAADIQTLESFCGDTASYFGRMYRYLMEFMEKGIGEGRFTGGQPGKDRRMPWGTAKPCTNREDITWYSLLLLPSERGQRLTW